MGATAPDWEPLAARGWFVCRHEGLRAVASDKGTWWIDQPSSGCEAKKPLAHGNVGPSEGALEGKAVAWDTLLGILEERSATPF